MTPVSPLPVVRAVLKLAHLIDHASPDLLQDLKAQLYNTRDVTRQVLNG